MSGAGARMHASDWPQRCSAAAISQANKGGLEKYPNASSCDHDQYCASSKNRSTVEKRSPTRRTIVSAKTMRAAVQKLRLGDIAEPEGEIISRQTLAMWRAMMDILLNRLSVNRIQIPPDVERKPREPSNWWSDFWIRPSTSLSAKAWSLPCWWQARYSWSNSTAP